MRMFGAYSHFVPSDQGGKRKEEESGDNLAGYCQCLWIYPAFPHPYCIAQSPCSRKGLRTGKNLLRRREDSVHHSKFHNRVAAIGERDHHRMHNECDTVRLDNDNVGTFSQGRDKRAKDRIGAAARELQVVYGRHSLYNRNPGTD